jgi:hypothetical protein
LCSALILTLKVTAATSGKDRHRKISKEEILMEDTSDKETTNPAKLELERVELEKQRLESDNTFRQAELDIKREELKAKTEGERRNRLFTSPLIATVLTAILGLLAAGVGAALQGYSNTKLERSKFEFTLIQKSLEIKDRKEAARNLKFLVDAGVIQSLNGEKIANLADKPENLPNYSSNPISVSFPEGTKFKDAIKIISEETEISISMTGCGESATNAAINPGKVSASSPAALIETLKYRIKDPTVKIGYQVKEKQPGSSYEVICVQ